MPRNIVDLSALSWQMGSVPRQLFNAQPGDDRAAVTAWLPARVPGDVRADLIAAGRIPPIETLEGIAAGAWADTCDWWYRAAVPGGFASDEKVLLEADGTDYYSAIWLDDRRLAVHEGMFSRQVVCLSPWINASEPAEHALAVRIWGNDALPKQPRTFWRRAVRKLIGRVLPGTEYFPDRMTTPKAQFSFGWDFAPRVLSTGIWDDIRLVICRSAYIEDLHVHAAPLTPADDPTPTEWQLTLRIRRWSTEAMHCRITLAPEGFDDAALSELERLLPGSQTIEGATEVHRITLHMHAARRWWPWDQGEPRRYRITAQLYDARGILDEISVVSGVRSVRRENDPHRSTWRFVVNGRPIFLRGANWTPADILPGRAGDADFARLLSMARAAGINFLRVWGGGIREKRAFWDTCDRLGIMAWQEFPLACAFLDHYPRDRAYLEVLAQEAQGIVQLLRNHPSLIAWCGGNEFNIGREHAALAMLAQATAGDAQARPFIPASPAPGEVHQWSVWHGYAPWATLAHETAPLMNEFGMQALPAAETIAEMFPEGAPTSLDDPLWAERKAQAAKLRWYAGIEASAALPAAIEATQRSQAAALQVGIEGCRLRREAADQPAEDGQIGCRGVAFWQFNEPWPAVSWSVVDRAGRPKLAYAMLRRSFQPLLVAARFPWQRYEPGTLFAAEIWLVNDGPEGAEGCRVEARLDDRLIWAQQGVALPAAAARRIGDCAIRLDAAPAEFTLILARDNTVLAENRYDLAVHLPPRQPQSARLRRWFADRLLGT